MKFKATLLATVASAVMLIAGPAAASDSLYTADANGVYGSGADSTGIGRINYSRSNPDGMVHK